MTLFELKEKMAMVGAQLTADAEWIAEKAASPDVAMEDIQAKKKHRDELAERFDMLKAEHDRLEAEQREALEQKAHVAADPHKAQLEARGKFYKAALTGGDMGSMAKDFEGLGAIPPGDASLGRGDNLLPSNMARDLLTEPFEDNSLRDIEPCSNITGLEEAKLDFSIEDEKLADITDKETAHEIETEGDLVTYGRFKTKIFATVKDTVLHGSPFNLAATIENALRSALAVKEKMRAFDTTPEADHRHMSFYTSGIRVVTGNNMFDTIIAAWASLAPIYQKSAHVVMRQIDYVKMIRDLSNGATSLFGKKPEEVLGIKVKFNDRAVKPVVGDFRYSRQNYDINTIYETDKDGKKGEYYFILTAWGDHRIRLKSAFRIVDVNENAAPGGGQADTSLAGLSLGALSLTPAFSPEVTDYTAATSNATTAITATPADNNAAVTITCNNAPLENSKAAWATGENTLKVRVDNDTATRTYTVMVTKS